MASNYCMSYILSHAVFCKSIHTITWLECWESDFAYSYVGQVEYTYSGLHLYPALSGRSTGN